MWIVIGLRCLIIAVLSVVLKTTSVAVRNDLPVFVGLAIDEHSLNDAVLLINSVLQSAVDPHRVRFLVLACGPDEISASRLRKILYSYLENPVLETASCPKTGIPGLGRDYAINATVRAFTLPTESGFAQQLRQHLHPKGDPSHKKPSNKHQLQASHWNSPSGADMARFFLPDVFNDVLLSEGARNSDRILYLDNDIIVSCCLEDIYFSEFRDQTVAGIALDDLKWATVTQFERHYNASHPLVISHIRTCQESKNCSNSDSLGKEEFLKAVPRYPNDGVILFVVSRYIKAGVLDQMNRIAAANVENFVVNLGTQQFTVLTMHNKWEELSPRVNLRHFPDMARGYLLWFYNHGVLHYAGVSKPFALCHHTPPQSPHGNALRMGSFTPWLIAFYYYDRDYASAVAKTNDSSSYVAADRSIALIHSREEAKHNKVCLSHVVTVDTIEAYQDVLRTLANGKKEENLVYVRIGDHALHKQTLQPGASFASTSKPLDQVDQIVRDGRARWSWLVYEAVNTSRSNPPSASSSSVQKARQELTLAIGPSYFDRQNGGDMGRSGSSEGIKKPRFHYAKASVQRSLDFISSQQQPLCRKEHPLGPVAVVKRSPDPAGDDGRNSKLPCLDVLEHLRGMQRKHWEVMAITIDATGSGSPGSLSMASVLPILYAINFHFLRPKVIFVALPTQSLTTKVVTSDTASSGNGVPSSSTIFADVVRFLRQQGFVLGSHNADCNTHKNVDNEAYVYVWGVRMNQGELGAARRDQQHQ